MTCKEILIDCVGQAIKVILVDLDFPVGEFVNTLNVTIEFIT